MDPLALLMVSRTLPIASIVGSVCSDRNTNRAEMLQRERETERETERESTYESASTSTDLSTDDKSTVHSIVLANINKWAMPLHPGLLRTYAHHRVPLLGLSHHSLRASTLRLGRRSPHDLMVPDMAQVQKSQKSYLPMHTEKEIEIEPLDFLDLDMNERERRTYGPVWSPAYARSAVDLLERAVLTTMETGISLLAHTLTSTHTHRRTVNNNNYDHDDIPSKEGGEFQDYTDAAGSGDLDEVFTHVRGKGFVGGVPHAQGAMAGLCIAARPILVHDRDHHQSDDNFDNYDNYHSSNANAPTRIPKHYGRGNKGVSSLITSTSPSTRVVGPGGKSPHKSPARYGLHVHVQAAPRRIAVRILSYQSNCPLSYLSFYHLLFSSSFSFLPYLYLYPYLYPFLP